MASNVVNGYEVPPPSFNTALYVEPEPGEEVVISGIAGRFPDSDNVKHFQDNLFNKVDMVSIDGRRWKLDHPEIPQRTGKINNLSKFDAVFFGIHFKQVQTMDPMSRILLEHTYEALLDAGVNPRQLRGTKTGVFIGVCYSESEKTWFYDKPHVNGFGITGCSKAMMANRISYWLGVHGPSYTLDTACSSSLFAIDHAYRAIRSGQCEAAIVGGANLCLHPYVSLQFYRLGVLSPDGCCKSFDADANGYARSEAIAVVYLQKAKNANRIYATVVHSKTNCDGFKEQGITYPSSRIQSILLQEFYDECKIPPHIIDFMEAHGTGTKVGDPEEISTIEKIYCANRTTPLRIGSVKSNIGHSEPSSGLCSIAKIIIAMESGQIPPNLHYKRPQEGVKPLEDGRIQVVTELTPWNGGYVGINSFGFGGANAHLLLKSNPKEKVNNGAPKDDLPRLVMVSGRTEESVASLLDDVESRPVDIEYVGLLQGIHAEEIPGHLYRGYTIAGGKLTGNIVREIQSCQGAKREIWFVFSGMGSQWPAMGQALMKFPVFAKAIQKCDTVLRPRGVDVVNILTSPDPKIFDNILNCFVGIAAVQIGLVDLLTSVSIVPDRLIGHSVGELGCAYADGCFTAEQMVLAAYSRGLASIETEFIHGSMAAVGLGYEALKNMCPPDIEIACHNSADSATISGPAESMKAFVAKLQADNIFAKEVACGNIPYHSRYIAAAGPKLLAYLKQVIPEPKPRSSKWVSTSVPCSEWSTAAARLSSAEYHTNNLLSSVLFEETARLIPKDAVTIEIAPHGLLQAILRRSLHSSVTNIALTKRGHKDNAEAFLQGLGKLYNSGALPQIANLYPPIEYPVSRGTPMISSLIKWEHSEDWYVTSYKSEQKILSGERIIKVSLDDEDFEYMSGHVIDGRNLVPATGYLHLVWETLAMIEGKLYFDLSVVMEDIRFLRATNVPREGTIHLIIMIQKGTGRFEVIEGGAAVVTGMIRSLQNPAQERINPDFLPENDEEEPMNNKDIYKEFKIRGYQYNGLFRMMQSASITGSKGHILWKKNWPAFMDNMLQLHILSLDTRMLLVPTRIEKLVIDAKAHMVALSKIENEEKLMSARLNKEFQLVTCGGIDIRGLRAQPIPRRRTTGDPVLEEHRFVAHRDNEEVSFKEALRVSLHLALENSSIAKVKTLELIDENDDATVEELASPLLLEAFGDLPMIQANVNLATNPTRFKDDSLSQNITVIEPKKITTDTSACLAIGHRLSSNIKEDSLKHLMTGLRNGGFLLTRESIDNPVDLMNLQKQGLCIVLEKRTDKERIIVLRKQEKVTKHTFVVRVNNNEFSWVEEIQSIMAAAAEKKEQVRLVIVGEKDYECGLLGLITCLVKEARGEIIRAVLIQDVNAPEFNLENPLYANQLELDLVVNVLRSGVWGTYRHLPLPPPEKKLVHHAIINQSVRGDLSSFRWIEGPITPDDDNEDIVDIIYAPINFKDVMVSSGKITLESTRFDTDSIIGLEFSGFSKDGRRIFGLRDHGCISNRCICEKAITWDIPDDWTLEDGATIPCVYFTAYYALYVKGNLQKSDKILIHSGSGGVGQAAIHLALFEGCEVFTTVGTPEKRKFIREKFPAIDDDHIGNSRDTSFEQLILKQTKGRGVDVVLNSLAEEKLQASVRCLAKKGRFLEIGKFDLLSNNPIGMEVFLKEIAFHGVMVDGMFAQTEEIFRQRRVVKILLDDGIKKGAVKPIVRNVFSEDQVEDAFRFMASGKHIGKVMIKVRNENEPLNKPVLAYPRYYCSKDKSYLVLGGLGGIGLELSDWLVLRGARKLVLTSRTGVRNGYQRMRIELWKSYGVEVLIISGMDASKREDCEFILKSAEKLGPVDAIYNLAVALRDDIFLNQTEDNFKELFKAKAWAAQRLDELSRKICPQLRHFVMFSSVSCGKGTAEQTNYGMANSVMERICEERVAAGLPGLAIQWGAIGDVGLVADMQDNNKELIIGGVLQQRISSCLEKLDEFLLQNKPVVSSMVVAEKRSSGASFDNILDTVLNIMGIKDLKVVNQQTSLAELGMDSMMAVEMKQTLEREFEVFLTAQDIRTLNFAKVIEMSTKHAMQEKSQQYEKIAGIKLLVQLADVTNALNMPPCEELPTKAESGRNEVFLIPGIEGVASIFNPLITELKCPASVLQLPVDINVNSSIQNMADYFVPFILAKRKNRKDFSIVGYSFGSLIAIEIVRILEASGMSGRLILIDGAPMQMRTLIEQHLPRNSEKEFENNVLVGIMDTMAPTISSEFAIALGKCTTVEEKLTSFTNCLSDKMGELPYTPEILRIMCMTCIRRLKAVQDYTFASIPPIKSPIILLKPTQQSVPMNSENYHLREITRDKVEVYSIEGNHVTILTDIKTISTINGDSPDDDAEEFKARILESSGVLTPIQLVQQHRKP